MAGAVADSEYTIRVEAQDVGANDTAESVNALADSLDAAEAVITEFDGALAAAGTQLAEAADLVSSTGDALATVEGDYKRLERAATAAAKRVEKAAAAGKDTSQLQARANAAAAAVLKQASAVDRARAASRSAVKAHERLADSYKKIERAAGRAADASRGQTRSFGDMFGAAGALGGPLGGIAGQISGIGDGLRAGGKGGGLILGFFVLGNAIIAAQKAAIAFTLAGVGLVAVLLKMAIAADEVTSKKLAKAWDDAKKKAKGLFEGVKTEKLVRPVRSLLKLLDSSTSAGKGLAKIFETLLNPVIDGFDKGEPLIKEFFKGIIIGALKAIIFVLRLRNAMLRVIPKETRDKIKDFISKLLGLGNAAKAGEGTFKILAFAVFALAGAFAILTIAMLVPIGLLALFTAVPIILVIKAIERLRKAFKGSSKDAEAGGKDAGTSFAQGIIDGIVSGAGAVAKEAKDLIKSAIGGAKEEAESASPSKVMIRFGRDDMAGGAAIGLVQGAPKVRKAGKRVGRAAVEGATERPAPSRGRGPSQAMAAARDGGGRTVNIESGAVQITVQGGGEELETAARRAAEKLLEMVAIQLGGEPASGVA
jgi:hypothetical protein